jgi:hypothetical protein
LNRIPVCIESSHGTPKLSKALEKSRFFFHQGCQPPDAFCTVLLSKNLRPDVPSTGEGIFFSWEPELSSKVPHMSFKKTARSISGCFFVYLNVRLLA